MDIYYKDIGQGTPVILLHGNQETHHIFDQLITDFQDDYRLIAIDSRYHGQSIKAGELSLRQMAQDVMTVADELSLPAYDVIGFSDGANIALTLAAMDERLKHMVLLSPNSRPEGIKLIYRLQMRLTMLCLLPLCLYRKRARLMLRLFRFMFKEPHYTADYLASLSPIALLISGGHDMIKADDLHFIAAHLPHCIEKTIPESGHFLLGDYYPDVRKEIRGFLYACHQ